MRSQETIYKYRRDLNAGTLPYFLEVGATKRKQQKKLKISGSIPEAKGRKVSKKKKLSTMSNAAMSSEMRIEN